MLHTLKFLRCCALLWVLGLPAVQAQVRVLDDADITETPARYDLTVRFSCAVRYLTHTPTDAGAELRVRLTLGADCSLPAQESLVSPAPAVVRSIELMPLLANEVELLVRWRLTQQFLVVPTNDQRGLRIRILRSGETAPAKGRVLVDDMATTDVTTAYAINLESSRTAFDEQAIEQAQSLPGGKVYVSEVDVAGGHWYRLRLGPVADKASAEQLLLTAQQRYPRAWLAIADEQVDEAQLTAAEPAASAEAPAASKRSDAAADSLWASASERFRRKDYAQAIELLTKLLARSGHQYGAEAQELLGLAHERSGELAHAQAEYETFLRDYPRDRRAARVRKRLNALRTATLPGRQANGGDVDEEGTWKINGGLAQYYRRDDNRLTVDTLSQHQTSQNALLNDFDLTARYRGFDTDTRIRISGGYSKDFLSDGPGDRTHVSAAFVEWSDRDRGWYTSLGRQNRSGSGSFGTFDGVLASYQWQPHFTSDVTIGMPVDSSRSGVNSKRLFETLSVNLGTFADAWEPSVYITHQTLEGQVDRQALGAELRYFRPGRVFIGFADYDLHFKVLNSVVLVGTLQLPARWSLNLDVEQRKSPLVTTRNALIGQPTASLATLSSAFNDEQIRQLALDRTSDTSVYSLTAARAIGERLQLTLTTQNIKTGATLPSDGSATHAEFPGVEGIPADGPELIISAQLLAASIMRAGDVNIIGIRQQSGGAVATTSLGLSSRVPVWGEVRLGPQLRIDRRQFDSDSSTLWLYAPSLRLNLQRRNLQLDLEAGSEISNRNAVTGDQKSTRYFYYAGYRWQF